MITISISIILTIFLSSLKSEDIKETFGMLESEDYYFENGKMIFTESFLLKRGKCCDNGCRHCPYNRIEHRIIECCSIEDILSVLKRGGKVYATIVYPNLNQSCKTYPNEKIVEINRIEYRKILVKSEWDNSYYTFNFEDLKECYGSLYC